MTKLDPALESEAIEQARRVRGALGLSPNEAIDRDLIEATEVNLQIPVTVLRLPVGVAGAYIRKRGRGFVFLQGDDVPTRQRFTLAHELGHHFLGHSPRVEDSSEVFGDPLDQIEAQANAFAGEFLMSAAAVAQWLDDNVCRRQFDLKDLVLAANAFHVSPPAMLYRLSAAQFEDQVPIRALWQDCEQQRHIEVARSLGIGFGDDELAQIAETKRLPRLPSQLVADATKAFDTGFIDEKRFREVMRSQ